MRLQDKIAIITGAASGIGRATALRFTQEGAKVVVADINEEGGQACVDEITANGGQAAFVKTDVSVEADLENMAQFTVDTFGGIDIYHNNAYWTEAKIALETTTENWQRTLDITLRPVFLGSKLVVPHMRARGGGVIVTTASIHSIVGVAGYAAYQASKGGMMALTRALALELAEYNIRVTAVLPGAINTPAVAISEDNSIDDFIQEVPLKRLGEPEEIANVVLFLASDEASYITGVGIVADGGYTIH
jgi:NAD(P)-dependent dehydrogenase (short-subunit alcohol dehydrogenase family)